MHIMHDPKTSFFMSQLPDFNLLRSFVILAEERNFRKAAERLALDQSALSRRMQKLEHLLGIQLFVRHSQGADITPAGQAFIRKITPLLLDYQNAVASAQSIAHGETGSLRIAFMAFAAYRDMPRAVQCFRNTYPNVEITLHFMPTEQQKQAFAEQQIDIGFMYQSYPHADYHSILITREKLCVVAPKTHPIFTATAIGKADLDQQPLILGNLEKWRDYRIRLAELYEAADMTMQVSIEATNTLAMIGLVCAGIGITIYPESLTHFLSHENIAAKEIDMPNFVSETTLVWPKSTSNPYVKKFIEILNA